jgi:hypothetical protein
MKINLSDTASESFILSKESSSKTFHFTYTEFHLYIIKASLVFELENSNWQQIIPKLAVKLNVYYHIIDATSIERAEDLSFPIYLFIDPNHVQPVFELNKLVDMQIFERYFDNEKISNIDVKIELIELQEINELYYLNFEISKQKI